MKHVLPRVSIGRWGGGDIDGLNDCRGWSLVVQWLGVIVEVCGGRVHS